MDIPKKEIISIIESLQNGLSENTHNIMNIDKTKVAYVVGIDLGHGETSAAECPLQWDTEESQWEAPIDIEMENNKKVIPSAITLLPDGRAFIGEKAFDPEILKQADVHVCFKKKPENIDGKSEKLMIRFMSEVYKLIRANTTGILTDDNHVVYIATPSGWDKKSQELYEHMAEEAGLPIAGVTKESRAAFIRGLHNPASGLKKKVLKGGIVFDMGSSTLDFTYMNNSNENELIDFGYNCGASFIEKFLYQIQDREGNIKQFENRYPELQNCLVYAARQVKEEVYFKPELKIRKIIHLDELVDDEEIDETVKFVFEPGKLNKMLDDAGYIKQIEDAMTDFLEHHIDNAPIYGVFLTGGASRMDFIKASVAKCFHISEDNIARDQDPSLTISQGVAEVARMDLRTTGVDVTLSGMINKLTRDNRIFDTFVEKYSFALYERMTENMIRIINNFSRSKEDCSLNYLKDELERQVSYTISSFASKGPMYIGKAINVHIGEIQKKVESIVAIYSKQGVQVNIPELKVDTNIKVDSNMSDVINNISEAIASEGSVWTNTITTGIISGTLAWIVGGPLAWILGGAFFIGKLFFGDSEEEKKEKALKKKLDKDKREKITDGILNEHWEEIKAKIKDSIYAEVSGNIQIKQSIKQTVKILLDSYKTELKNARILVD